MVVCFVFVVLLSFFFGDIGKVAASALLYRRAMTEIPAYVFKYGIFDLEASGTA